MERSFVADLLTNIEALRRRIARLERGLPEIAKFIGPSEDGDLPFSSTAWDGDGYSTTGKTLIDLSSVFSAPASIHWVLVEGMIRDEDAANTNCWLILSPNNTSLDGTRFTCTAVNDRYTGFGGLIACNSDGDIYYQTNASGSGTLDIQLRIRGYIK